MRIALHAEGELAVRTSKVLLAEPDTEVGLFGDDSMGARIHRVTALQDWDVLAVDELSIGSRVQIERAFGLGVPVVLATEGPPTTDQSVTVVVGVLEGARIATALAESGLGGSDDLMDAQLGWTVPGHLLSEGVAVTFPEPLGPLWADRDEVPATPYPASSLAAPVNGPWRGITARLTLGSDAGVRQQIFGMADDANFLDAVVLASAAMAAAEGAYPTGFNGPGDPDGVFIRNAQRAGLDVARFEPA
jgi:hypothetical protein